MSHQHGSVLLVVLCKRKYDGIVVAMCVSAYEVLDIESAKVFTCCKACTMHACVLDVHCAHIVLLDNYSGSLQSILQDFVYHPKHALCNFHSICFV